MEIQKVKDQIWFLRNRTCNKETENHIEVYPQGYDTNLINMILVDYEILHAVHYNGFGYPNIFYVKKPIQLLDGTLLDE